LKSSVLGYDTVTEVSEEANASINTVERIFQLGITIAVIPFSLILQTDGGHTFIRNVSQHEPQDTSQQMTLLIVAAVEASNLTSV
jgi:hypothetical protein